MFPPSPAVFSSTFQDVLVLSSVPRPGAHQDGCLCRQTYDNILACSRAPLIFSLFQPISRYSWLPYRRRRNRRDSLKDKMRSIRNRQENLPSSLYIQRQWFGQHLQLQSACTFYSV